MVQEGTGAPGDVLEAAEQKIYAIRRGRSAQSMATIQVVLQEVMEHLAELSAQGGKTLPGLSTGFSAVDGKINGLNKSDLLLLAARPGMGKTSMALNVALNAAKESGQTVAVFSLEMSRDQLVTRLLASEGLIENTRLISGDLRESDWVKIAEGASSLSRLDIRIDDNPLLTVAVVCGVDRLHGAAVRAKELRGGASLVLAGLQAEGETTVTGVEHIQRGYEDLTGELAQLGADIRQEER